MSYRELPDSVTDLEERVLRTWREEDTFRRSLEVREGEPEFVFYEGPPTANGRPGVHHVIARTIKDLVARYRTMTGHHVTRIAGWDTHGLPVEIEAEEQLGISGKPEIEALGIGEFNATCRENLFTYKDEWERLSRRIGYWLDYENAYITCSADFVESVWWAISEIERRGLLYKGYKVLPYCPRCGTGLSSHEVAQGYARRSDPSLYSLFPVLEGGEGGPGDAQQTEAEAADRHLLVWTTTPWTLVSNVAVAYGPDLPYVEVEAERAGGEGGEAVRVILSRRRAEALVEAAEEGEGAAAGEHAMGRQPFRLAREALEEARTVPPSELEGLRYRRPLDLLPEPIGEPGRLYPADFVSDEEGTGFVHVAPAFGADDFALGRERDLPVVRPVDDEGRFEEGVAEVGGRRVKEADDRLVELLEERGLLFAVGRVQHQYPHCWRCDSPLLYMARDSWYVETTAVKDRLLENNAAVQWCPPEIGSGRMGEWLENNVDWALSRDRYWGTPLPIWECDEDADHREVLGSYEELAERTGGLPDDFDPHRPEIDRHAWACPEEGCPGTLHRVEGVADAWFDSGSMPYAQWHYPFENEAAFEDHFPADFIAEGVDQTRGWFYSLLALATILFDSPAYRAVVVNDLILDAEGQKMSKSRGNTVDPWEALERHGADAIRWFLISSSNPWIPKRWDPEGLGEVSRTFFDTLRNSYRFFALYAGLEGWGHAGAGPEREEVAGAADELPAEDRWLLSRLDTITRKTRSDLDDYELTRAARRLSSFVVDELSNWYVRRTRDRFWATGDAGEEARRDTRRAFATLHEALRVTSLLLAPFAPFLSDWLHRELTGGSAHVADFPEARGRSDPGLEQEMEDARELAALGRAARERKGVRVRQPLRTLKAVLPGGRRLSAEVTGLLREELNVKAVEFLDHGDQLVALRAKPDYSELGPRFGSDTPAVAEAVADLPEEVARRLREGERVAVEAAGREVEVGPEEVKVLEEARGDLAVGSGGGYLAALDPTIDEELRREGLARELVNRVQNLRREAGLEVDDRIELAVAGPGEVAEAARAHRDYVAGETLAVDLRVAEDDDPRPEAMEHSGVAEIEGHPVRLGLRRSVVEAERAP